MTRKILILAANSKNTSHERFDEQVREIENALERAKHHDQFTLVPKWTVRPRDIQRAMLDHNPYIVHFLGRAAGFQGQELENESDRKLVPLPEDSTESEGLVLEDETGQAKLVEGEALAYLCKLFADKLECVVFNGCYLEKQAEEIAKCIPYVIGTKDAVSNKAARDFAVGFYDALGAGHPVKSAYKLGCAAIQLAGFPERSTPFIHRNQFSNIVTTSESETLEKHYDSIIKTIIKGRIIPFLGSDINLCDRIQANEELEPWESGSPFPPSGKELAAYLAQNFPPQLEKIICYKKEKVELHFCTLHFKLCLENLALPLVFLIYLQKWNAGGLQEEDPRINKKDPRINKVIHEHAILIYLDNKDKGSLHVGGEALQYLSQYAYLTDEGKFYDQLEQVQLGHRPNRLHQFFATLPAIMRKKGYYPPYPLIVTTNYDCALEQAFKDAKEPFDLIFYSNVLEPTEKDRFVHRKPDGTFQDIINPNEYKGLSFEQRPVILKLYGTADQIREREGESMVITEEHYIEYLVTRNLSNLLPATILRKLRAQNPNILFLGYSLADWNQRIILHRIWHNLTSKKRFKWWAIQSNTDPLSQKLWESYDIDIHDIPLSSYISGLSERVQNISVKGDKGYE